MNIEKFNKFQKAILKYIPDELHADDDLILILDCLSEIKRNYIFKKNKHERKRIEKF